MAEFTPLTRRTTFAGDGSQASAARSADFLPLKGSGRKTQSFAGVSSHELTMRKVLRSNFHIKGRGAFDVTSALSESAKKQTNKVGSGSSDVAVADAAGTVKATTATEDSRGMIVVVVDALSTGACVAEYAQQRGYTIVHCTSLAPSPELADMVPGHLKGGALKWFAELGVNLELAKEDLGVAAADLAQRLHAAIQTGQPEKGRAGMAGGLASVACILVGAETGVRLADFLIEAVNAARPPESPKLRGNTSQGSEARREKFAMGEKVRAAGVRAVKQFRFHQGDDVALLSRFLVSEWGTDQDGSFLAVVKPLESAGSDGVTCCKSFAEVHAAVEQLLSLPNALGQVNEGVLVQEFLRGPEYVIDGVSCDGAHVVTAMWRYDRRAINGAGFVCCGQKLLGPDTPEANALRDYASSVLDALELKVGSSHMEVKLLPSLVEDITRPDPSDTGLGSFPNFSSEVAARSTPCLVEVGARCHGAEGFWISVCDESYGHSLNQAALCLSVYAEGASALEQYAPYAPGPAPLAKYGAIKFLTFHTSGTLRGNNNTARNGNADVSNDNNGDVSNNGTSTTNHVGPTHAAAVAAMVALPSYRTHELFVQAGAQVTPTIDCFTWGGVVKLCHESEAQLDEDYATIEALCLQGLWAWQDGKE